MNNKPLNIYAFVLSSITFLLVIAGGLVTSTGSGLAVPDWPLSFGQVFPRMEGGVFFEHGHRMIATTVGLMTLLLAVWMHRVEPRPLLRRLSIWAVVLVVIQGVFGGVTVILGLPPVTSVVHAVLAQTFFCLIISIALLTWRSDFVLIPKPALVVKKIKRLGVLTIVFIYLQLIIGAIYRHSGWGLHLHMAFALLPLIHIFLFTNRVRIQVSESRGMVLGAGVLRFLVCLQILLGVLAWRTYSVPSTTLHVAVGALLLAGTMGLTLMAHLRLRPA